jgi:methylmalonyl-CoA mutase cobalamin-binding domain/chain
VEKNEMTDKLTTAIVDLQRDVAIEEVKKRIDKGDTPIDILEACRQGMSIVGERFQKGDYFLAELMLSAEIFKGAMSLLEPHLSAERSKEPIGRVMLATLKGDIHDLGKNLFSSLLQASGFEVLDLGVDVEPKVLVEQVKQTRPQLVGFSALITTAFPSMKEATDGLKEAGLRDSVKIMVGGGVTTPMVKDYIGADFQTLDATEGVAYCLSVVGGS